MADDSEQEKYYKYQREKTEREESEKTKKDTEEKTKKDIHKASFFEQLNSLKNGLTEDFDKGNISIIKLILLPFAFLGILINVIKSNKIFKWIFILLIIVPLGLIFWGFFYNLLTGGGVSIFGTQLSILGSETAGPLKAITDPIKNFYTDPVGTIAQYGTFKPPETVEKRKPQGVEFKKFETKKPIHRANIDEIETVANVKIYALEDSPTQVKFSCEKSDPVSLEKNLPAEKIIISGELEDSNSVYIFEGQDKSINVQCKFDKVDLTAIDLVGEKTKTIQEKITLKADYEDFVVNSRIKIYTLENQILDNIENQNLNPFNYFKINDPLISSERSVRSEQIKSGPVILSLNLLDAQPLTEGPTYLLSVEVYNDNLNWNGKIAKLKDLRLLLPEGFSPTENCKEFSQENKLLKLKTEVLSKLNEVDKERFYCDFKIDSSAVTDSLDYSLIQAEAKFDYSFEAYTAATISKNLLSDPSKS